jgi:hypothetical protein
MKLREVALQVWLDDRDADGVVEKQRIVSKLGDILIADPMLMDPHKVAREMVDEIDRALQPKFDDEQMSMFHPDAYLPTGDGRRVQMDMATRIDFQLYWAEQIKEFAASAAAHARKGQYVGSRLAKWADRYPTLGELERIVFDWKPKPKK